MIPDLPLLDIATAAWLVFAVVWVVLAVNVKSTQKRESGVSRLGHFLPLVVAVYLFANQLESPWTALNQRFVPDTLVIGVLGDVLSIAGVAGAIWARLALGRNWSASVMQKSDHELVTDGPFRYVRHPIYTGILTGMLGYALVLGEWRALLGVVISWLAFWRKYRLEEHFMIELFGSRYLEYRRRVPALLPIFVRHA